MRVLGVWGAACIAGKLRHGQFAMQDMFLKNESFGLGGAGAGRRMVVNAE